MSWPGIIWNQLKKLKVLCETYNDTYIHNYNTYFLGCPRILRADHGTENAIAAQAHIAFRLRHTDRLAGSKSFIYGPSTANIVCKFFNSYVMLLVHFYFCISENRSMVVAATKI